MKNRDSLFDRINLFYKMAFFGDRAIFLKSMAQQAWPAQINLPEETIVGNPPNPKAPRQIINVPEQVIEGTPPQQIKLPEQVITGTPPLKGKPLTDLFARVYAAVRAGGQATPQDKALWADNAFTFKQRESWLDKSLAAERAKGAAANMDQIKKWQAESNAIKFVNKAMGTQSNSANDANDASEHKMCNCEQLSCERAGKHKSAHCKNKAGHKRAMYIGSICDECAKTMPKEYMLEDKK